MRHHWINIALVGVLAVSACTDTELMIKMDPDSSIMRLEIDAEMCAPEPIVEEVPYKILFVIDTSLSNRWNDPDEHRVEAYIQAIESHADRSSVYFGIITFSDYANRPTLVFTSNQDILLTAAQPLANDHAGGGTNYENAIQEMYQFIVDDLNALSNAAMALRTHYLVYWLSDGIPTFGTTDRPTLVANVEAVRQYLTPKVGEFRLNTLYLESSGEWESEEEIAGARQLLKEMSEAGGGDFTNIASGESFEFDIDPAPQIRDFRFVSAVAANRNAYFGAEHPLPDSDGDGLIDSDELALGLDPTEEDTDGDYYRDGVEHRADWMAPDEFDLGCNTEDLDSDGDGLRDCEEEVIGTDPKNPDTDEDYLPDALEYFMDGSPLSGDPNTDADLDESTDFTEVLIHMAPRLANSKNDQNLWAYRYQLADEWVDPESEQLCYGLRVSNVSIYETLETPVHPRGWQVVELVVAFETDDGLGTVKFYRAEGRVGIRLPSFQEPPSGTLRFEPANFSLLRATGGDTPDPGMLELCNGLDDDLDGIVPENEQDRDSDGFLVCGGDCDDQDSEVHPEAEESCNELDDNCDGAVDENCGCTNAEARFCGIETGACKMGIQTCSQETWGPCEGHVGPQAETCNGLDDNCDGQVDEVCSCEDGQIRPCGPEREVSCQTGRQTCLAGVWTLCEETGDLPGPGCLDDGELQDYLKSGQVVGKMHCHTAPSPMSLLALLGLLGLIRRSASNY